VPASPDYILKTRSRLSAAVTSAASLSWMFRHLYRDRSRCAGQTAYWLGLDRNRTDKCSTDAWVQRGSGKTQGHGCWWCRCRLFGGSDRCQRDQAGLSFSYANASATYNGQTWCHTLMDTYGSQKSRTQDLISPFRLSDRPTVP
jgi:hypothetical protein